MSSDFFYLPVTVAEYLADEVITMMTPEQEAAFFRLRCHAWKSENPVLCSLPNDDHALAQLSRLGDKRWKAVGGRVRDQFQPVPGEQTRLRNEGLWVLYQELSAKRGKRVRAGAMGGNAKAIAQHSRSNATDILERSANNGLPKGKELELESHSKQELEEEGEAAATTTAAIVREVIPEQFRAELDNLMAHVPDRELWAREIQTRCTSASPGVVGQAIRDMAANGKLDVPNLRQFGRYVLGVLEESKTSGTSNGLSTAEETRVDQILEACNQAGIFTALDLKDFDQRRAAVGESGEFTTDEVAALARINRKFCNNAVQRNDRAGLKRHVASVVFFRPEPPQERKHATNGQHRTNGNGHRISKGVQSW